MHCLIIDDDIPTIEALVEIIDWHRYGIAKVVTAYNMQHAIKLYEEAVPDLIICDIEMPRGSGIDMIKWVRDERGYEGGFIFFTCHQSFEFAATAISYHADNYLVKPLDKNKLEEALEKSIDKLKQKREMGEYSKLGQSWLKNKDVIENSFWKDILSSSIPSRADIIQGEIVKRELTINAERAYTLLLISIPSSGIEMNWQPSLLLTALSNICSEIMFDRVNHHRVIPYQVDHVFYTAIVVEEGQVEHLKQKSELIIMHCKQYFKCTATCYIGEPLSIAKLAQTKQALEGMDASNIIFRGIVHYQNDPFNYAESGSYMLDVEQFSLLFIQREKLQIINKLRKELEALSEQNRLDSLTLHSIKEDFLQVVYSYLTRNHIQAHRLFVSETAQQLSHHAERSIFDFIKWAHMLTEQTIISVNAAQQSEGVVDKAKRFIQENYMKDLTREDVAASVFLTSDYFSKVFKNETGLTIREYLNEWRINQAKQLLVESSKSISVIAMETGFDSMSYFSTVFKKLTGETPNSYRARHK